MIASTVCSTCGNVIGFGDGKGCTCHDYKGTGVSSKYNRMIIDSNGQLHFDQERKFDAGKLRYDLIPPKAIKALAEVLTYGANKYADNSWKQVKPFNDRYYAALMRHLMAWREGELKDSESGLPHLAHALCNVMFLLVGGDGD